MYMAAGPQCLTPLQPVIELQCQTGVTRRLNGNAKSLASINYLPGRGATPACAVSEAPSKADCFIGERSVLRGNKEERPHAEGGSAAVATLRLK